MALANLPDDAKSYAKYAIALYIAFGFSWEPHFGLLIFVVWLPAVWLVNYRRNRDVNMKRTAFAASLGALLTGLLIRGAMLYGPIKKDYAANFVGIGFVICFAVWVYFSIELARARRNLFGPGWGMGAAPLHEAAKTSVEAQLKSAREELTQAEKRLLK
jgi:hypothetical protein